MMRVLCVALGAGVGLLGPAPAQAANLPAFDVAAYCASVARAGGGSYMIESGCRDMEMQAKRSIQSRAVAPRILNYCIDVAWAGGGSYMILEGCIDMEEQAKRRMQN